MQYRKVHHKAGHRLFCEFILCIEFFSNLFSDIAKRIEIDGNASCLAMLSWKGENIAL